MDNVTAEIDVSSEEFQMLNEEDKVHIHLSANCRNAFSLLQLLLSVGWLYVPFIRGMSWPGF